MDGQDELIALFYASALGQTPWSATIAKASALFRSHSAVLSLSDVSDAVVAAETYGPNTAEFAMEYYSGEIFAADPRRPYMINLPTGAVYYDQMLYDVEAMNRDPRVRAATDAMGLTYSLGVRLRLPDDGNVAFAVLNDERRGHASAADIEAFRRLAPHIEQACGLGYVMAGEVATRVALQEALAARAEGVLLLDRRGRPIFVNDAAGRILAARDGLTLAAETPGALAAGRPPESRKLEQLVSSALDGGIGGRALVSRPSGRPPYVVSVMAAPSMDRFLTGHAIGCVIHLQDLGATHLPSREALQSVFGLTERETDLAIELVRCADLARAAKNAAMAFNTARNHLHGILVKTGASGQAGLVQLLGRLP